MAFSACRRFIYDRLVRAGNLCAGDPVEGLCVALEADTAGTCAAQWAALTLLIVGAPEYVGAAAWVAIQRIAGNIVGGYIGYGGDSPLGTSIL